MGLREDNATTIENFTRDALALGDALDNAGALESAVVEYMTAQQVEKFRESKLSAADYCELLRTEKPHLFPAGPVVDLADAAFGQNCSLRARATLCKQVGETNFLQLAKDWQVNLSRLEPGVAPASAAAVLAAKPAAKVDTTNPWNSRYVEMHGLDAAREAQAGIIKRLGSKAASGMARGAGVTLGGQRLK